MEAQRAAAAQREVMAQRAAMEVMAVVMAVVMAAVVMVVVLVAKATCWRASVSQPQLRASIWQYQPRLRTIRRHRRHSPCADSGRYH